jgi:HNH endonuclease
MEMEGNGLMEPCYESTRAPSQKYPMVPVNYNGYRRPVGMHRIVWMFANGPIPPGLMVLHRCDNMRCVHLPHLYLGTHEQNMKDMTDRGRHVNQKKTHCPKGHPLDGVRSNGFRWCMTCNRMPEEELRDRTHCARGHLFDEENTITSSYARGRACRACRNESRRRRAKERGIWKGI